MGRNADAKGSKISSRKVTFCGLGKMLRISWEKWQGGIRVGAIQSHFGFDDIS